MNYGLAPMEGITELPTRLWFSQTARVPLMCAPFLRVTATYPKDDVTPYLWPEVAAARGLVNYRVQTQLMAADAAHFIRAAEPLLSHVDAVELNCGCPSPTVVGHGAGSSILKSSTEFAEKMAIISAALGPGRLSVKMRTGFDCDSEFDDLLSGVAELPLAKLTVHGRTRLAHYSGRANWRKIAAAAARAQTSVVGSGDIVSRQSYTDIGKEFAQVNSCIIGRGALRNPWLFLELQTGAPVQLERAALVYALASFAVLQFLYKENFPVLRQLLDAGTFLNICANDTAAWAAFYKTLVEKTLGHYAAPEELTFTRQILGRTKMTWSFMRSGIDGLPLDATVLRSRSFAEYFARLVAVLPPRFTFAHQPQYDYLYAGRREKTAVS